MALSDAVMLSTLRDGGAVLRRAGSVEADAGRNGACGPSPMPRADRLVSGVPSTPSRGGAAGLPDFPREARGRGVLSRGGVGMGGNMGCHTHSLKSPVAARHALPMPLSRLRNLTWPRIVLYGMRYTDRPSCAGVAIEGSP